MLRDGSCIEVKVFKSRKMDCSLERGSRVFEVGVVGTMGQSLLEVGPSLLPISKVASAVEIVHLQLGPVAQRLSTRKLWKL